MFRIIRRLWAWMQRRPAELVTEELAERLRQIGPALVVVCTPDGGVYVSCTADAKPNQLRMMHAAVAKHVGRRLVKERSNPPSHREP